MFLTPSRPFARRPRALALVLAAVAILAVATAAPGQTAPDQTSLREPPPAPEEAVFYMTGSEASLESFRRNAGRIDVVAPQTFSVEGDGLVWGEVDPQVLETARSHGVKVMPLVHNPGFDQEAIHELLDDSAARARAVATLVELAERHDLHGWQFDFEHVYFTYRDRLTDFFQEAARALRPRGYVLSIAVVPDDGAHRSTRHGRWHRANWSGAYDLAALAEAGDFISLMTYDQHGRLTTPGPVAGLPWSRRMVLRALEAGVPLEKLSLGIPAYSRLWQTVQQGEEEPRVGSTGLGHRRAASLIERHGAEPLWLPEQGTHQVAWEIDGIRQWLFLEDRRSFTAKLGLLEEFPGLRGISVWVLGLEDPGVWDLLPPRRR